MRWSQSSSTHICRPTAGTHRNGPEPLNSLQRIFEPRFWSTDRIVEAVAVIASFLYTFLYIKESAWCWPFAFIGSALFTYLCYARRILAESFLQFFYVLMAVYGYMTMGNQWQANVWSWQSHLIWIAIGTVGMFISAFLLKRFTTAQMPLEDSFTTVFSLIATWIMVNYVHENYLYWIVIDLVSVHLYWKRKLYFGSALFVAYTILVTAGYFRWM
ncbi:MAG: nicotinamide riboside transporter PnuC [Flavobacteriales bacterium]|nr:nicotinamide riboside transporter PnuC [Flavobacteriales bacterium]